MQLFDISPPYDFTCTERASIEKAFTVSLCDSIESTIQWFQILVHYGIIFVSIHNPAVYLSGARVSISPTCTLVRILRYWYSKVIIQP